MLFSPSLHEKKLAAVSYIPLLGPVIAWAHRRDAFIGRHAVQGSLIGLYLVLAYFVPGVGPYLALAFTLAAIGGFAHAMQGQEFEIPVFSDLAGWLAAQLRG